MQGLRADTGSFISWSDMVAKAALSTQPFVKPLLSAQRPGKKRGWLCPRLVWDLGRAASLSAGAQFPTGNP